MSHPLHAFDQFTKWTFAWWEIQSYNEIFIIRARKLPMPFWYIWKNDMKTYTCVESTIIWGNAFFLVVILSSIVLNNVICNCIFIIDVKYFNTLFIWIIREKKQYQYLSNKYIYNIYIWHRTLWTRYHDDYRGQRNLSYLWKTQMFSRHIHTFSTIKRNVTHHI